MKRLVVLLTVMLASAGCAFLRESGASGGPPTDAGPSESNLPSSTTSPEPRSSGPLEPDPPSVAPSTPSSASPSPKLATAAPNDPIGSGILTGTLGYDATEGGCAYLEADDGTRYEVLYPDGWHVDRATRHLVGPNGTDAQPGAVVSVRGSIDGGMASMCQVGPIFRATEVISAGG